jgi:alpha-glucan,water dikinase
MGGKNELLAVVRHEEEGLPVRVDIFTDLQNKAVMHWGINEPGTRKWSVPPEELWPEATDIGGQLACDTKLLACEDDECDVEIAGSKVPLQRTTIWLPPDHTIASLSFVLRSADSTMWYKNADKDFFVPVPGKFALPPDKEQAVLPDRVTKAIVAAENSSAWTLMHRFNKAADVLSEILNGYYEDVPQMDAMSYVYVWLRYSATRQLTWQRNYNTQPRILSAAQERCV